MTNASHVSSDDNTALNQKTLRTSAILVVLGFAPVLCSYGLDLWSREYYQFFPMALIAALYLGWERLREWHQPAASQLHPAGLLLLGMSIGILGLAAWLWSPWLGYIAFLLFLAGLFWSLGGWKLFVVMAPSLLLLAILVRPPLNYDQQLVFKLRTWAVHLSSCVLDVVFDIPHFVAGNVIELPAEKLLVEEACSGINSFLYAIFVALFVSLWQRRHWVHTVLLVLGSASFVILGNVVRIAGGGALKYFYGIDVLRGWRHEMLGLVLFVSYMILVISLDALFCFFTVKDDRKTSHALSNWLKLRLPTSEPSRLSWPRLIAPIGQLSGRISLVAAIVIALMAPVQVAKAWLRSRAVAAQETWRSVPAGLQTSAKFSVPAKIGDWELLNTDKAEVRFLETRGIYSHIWAYRNGRVTAYVALDYPYPELHDFTYCYRGQGWQVGKPAWNRGNEQSPAFAYAEMNQKPLTTAVLFFGAFTGTGRWIESDEAGLDRRLGSRLETGGAAGAGSETSYQVQTLAPSYISLTDAEKEQVRQLFMETRSALFKQVMEQLHAIK